MRLCQVRAWQLGTDPQIQHVGGEEPGTDEGTAAEQQHDSQCLDQEPTPFRPVQCALQGSRRRHANVGDLFNRLLGSLHQPQPQVVGDDCFLSQQHTDRDRVGGVDQLARHDTDKRHRTEPAAFLQDFAVQQRRTDSERGQDPPRQNDVRQVLAHGDDKVDQRDRDQPVPVGQQNQEQGESHEIERETDGAFEVESPQSMQDAAKHAADHPDGNVDSQNQDRNAGLQKFFTGPAAPPSGGRAQYARHRQGDSAHRQIDRQHERHHLVDAVWIPLRMVLRNVPRDRFAQTAIEQPGVAGDRVDQQPTAVRRLIQNLQRVTGQEEPDHQVRGVGAPTGEDVAFDGAGDRHGRMAFAVDWWEVVVPNDSRQAVAIASGFTATTHVWRAVGPVILAT